ncbi:unnamed protein product [Trichobilharzia regenti]|nr:unnamed protein product [Trichobilharzia regenti]
MIIELTVHLRTLATMKMPEVSCAPLRMDILNFVHHQIHKNSRQPYAVSTKTGHQTSDESWVTGRAVARIFRLLGGSFHRYWCSIFGHRYDCVPELPLVVSSDMKSAKKTKDAVKMLKAVQAWPDMQKVYNYQQFRAEKGEFPQGCDAFKSISSNIHIEESGLRADSGVLEISYTQVCLF